MKRNPSENLKLLARQPYPGRGIGIGLSEDATEIIRVLFTEGRSVTSRNRVIEESGPRTLLEVHTAVADPSKPTGNPETTLYTGISQAGDGSTDLEIAYAVSNGHHTTSICEAREDYPFLFDAAYGWDPEPDPLKTPRIGAVAFVEHEDSPDEEGTIAEVKFFELAIARPSVIGSECCDRAVWTKEAIKPGTGYFLTTYDGECTEGDPQAFYGEPFVLPLGGNPEHYLWEALNEDNRVSLVVVRTKIATGMSIATIINKYEKVEAAV